MDAGRSYLDLRPFRPFIPAVGPSVIVAPAAQVVRKGSCLAVQTGVARVIAPAFTPCQNPHIMHAGLDKVNLIVQTLTIGGIVAAVSAAALGSPHTGNTCKAACWPGLLPFMATYFNIGIKVLSFHRHNSVRTGVLVERRCICRAYSQAQHQKKRN
ncbi:hypothetical protein ES703_113777 [subsurface metagenome]